MKRKLLIELLYYFIAPHNAIRNSIIYAHLRFAADLNYRSSASRAVKFTKEYPLPRPKFKAAVFYKHLPAASDNRAFAVRIRITFAMPIAGQVDRH